MTSRRWIDLSPEDKAEIYAIIDDNNALYMKSISASEPIWGGWYFYKNEYGQGIKQDMIGHGVTTKEWCSL